MNWLLILEPSVQAIALGHLFQIDPNLIVPLLGQTITSADANVRRWSAQVLVVEPSPERLALLAPLLDDPHPDVRQYVCDSLVSWQATIRCTTWSSLRDDECSSADGWRGREQAILLLVTLDDKSIVDRLLSLLEDDRTEVHATAAWGLCRLNVAATTEPILQVFTKKTELWMAGERQKIRHIHPTQPFGAGDREDEIRPSGSDPAQVTSQRTRHFIRPLARLPSGAGLLARQSARHGIGNAAGTAQSPTSIRWYPRNRKCADWRR